MKLYEITKEYEDILNEIYTEDGEINEQAMIRLTEMEAAMEKKAIAISSYLKNMEAERDAIKAAKTAMYEREKRYNNRIEGLQNYLIHNMERCGITKINCPYFDISLRKNIAVDVQDDKLIPDQFKRIKTEISPDKIKIREALNNGEIVPGAALKTNLSLQIK